VDGSRHARRLAGTLLAFLGSGMVVALLALGPLAEGQGVLESLRRGVLAQNAFRQGKALYDARDYEKARERFSEAVALEPHHDEAQALLGWSEYFLGEYRAAAISFKTALQRQPTWEGLYDGLGWSRLRLRRYHLASEAFRAALDLNPDYVDAMIGLGSAQFELARYEAALPPLQTAMRRLEPMVGEEPADLHGVRAKVAWSLFYLGRYGDALGLFQRALRARPDWHGLHNGVGWCQLKLGRKDDARASFQRALSLNPGYEDALEGLRQARG
jgi:tetratricopeptide (TPR) repeat protein